ncbi:MAG TPA: hypothetical protein VIF43_02525 [Patescibacteria group bacterium]
MNRNIPPTDGFAEYERAELGSFSAAERQGLVDVSERRHHILERVRDKLRPLWTHDEEFLKGYVAEYQIPIPEGCDGTEGPELLDAISDDDLQAWLEDYETRFVLGSEKHRERFERYFTEFLGAAEQAIEDGWLPLTRDELYERIGWVNPRVYSGLAAALYLRPDGRHGIGGYFNDDESIGVTDDTTSEILQRHYFFHEMVHMLAGRTILAYRDSDSGNVTFHHQRNGLHFRVGTPHVAPRIKKRLPRGRIHRPLPVHDERTEDRLRWLNEAVTEEVARRLDNMAFDTYDEERRLKRQYQHDGDLHLLDQVFLEAYFENHRGSASGSKVPKWKALRRLADEAHGKGFLFKLDDAIRFAEYEERQRALKGEPVSGKAGIRAGRRLIRQNVLERDPQAPWQARSDYLYRTQIHEGHGQALAEIGRLYDIPAVDLAAVLGVKKRTIRRWQRDGIPDRDTWRRGRIDTLRFTLPMLEGLANVPQEEIRDMLLTEPELVTAIQEDSVEDLREVMVKINERRSRE